MLQIASLLPSEKEETNLQKYSRVHIHERIKVRLKSGIIETTCRVIFNRIVPEKLGFQNYSLP